MIRYTCDECRNDRVVTLIAEATDDTPELRADACEMHVGDALAKVAAHLVTEEEFNRCEKQDELIQFVIQVRPRFDGKPHD